MKRFALVAMASLVVAATSPSRAATDVSSQAAAQVRLMTESRACRALNAARRYGESLSPCLDAAARYRRAQDGPKTSRWFFLYAEADMLAYAAADRAGLDQHADALTIALDAHRTLAYIETTFTLDPDSKRQVDGLVAVLVRFERVERVALRGAAPPGRAR